jgi:hypothetical protein
MLKADAGAPMTITRRCSAGRAAGAGAGTGADEPAREHLHAVVLEGGFAQPVPLPAAAADAHAQYEIRVYAEAIAEMVRDWVPAAYGAFEDYRMGGVQVSAKGVEVLRRRLAGEVVTQETSGMSKGEWREFRAGADSDLILRSFSEYESLYDPLRAVPELAKKNKDLLTYVDGFESYSPEVFEGLGEYAQIDPKEWQQVRKVKTYFKGRFELIGKGFFSDAAIANTMDRAGVNLARRELYQLDKAIFYQVRKEKYDAGLHSDEYLACTFKEDLGWYEALPAFMKKQATSFGWDRP